jgi:hypothetical protein
MFRVTGAITLSKIYTLIVIAYCSRRRDASIQLIFRYRSAGGLQILLQWPRTKKYAWTRMHAWCNQSMCTYRPLKQHVFCVIIQICVQATGTYFRYSEYMVRATCYSLHTDYTYTWGMFASLRFSNSGTGHLVTFWRDGEFPHGFPGKDQEFQLNFPGKP